MTEGKASSDNRLGRNPTIHTQLCWTSQTCFFFFFSYFTQTFLSCWEVVVAQKKSCQINTVKAGRSEIARAWEASTDSFVFQLTNHSVCSSLKEIKGILTGKNTDCLLFPVAAFVTRRSQTQRERICFTFIPSAQSDCLKLLTRSELRIQPHKYCAESFKSRCKYLN